MKKRTLLVSTFLVALAIGAQAQSISYNYDSNGTVGNPDGSYNGVNYAGAYSTVGWINDWSTYPTANLMDNTGAATTLSLSSFNNSGMWNLGSHPGQDANGTYNNELLNGYINGTGAGNTGFTLSQIPYSTYDIYVYFMSDDGTRVGTVTDGASTYYFGADPGSVVSGGNAVLTQATATDNSGFNTQANYAVFSGLTGASQTISTEFFSADGVTANYGGITGWQVVAAPVPEPGSFALAGFGGLAMLVLLRRK